MFGKFSYNVNDLHVHIRTKPAQALFARLSIHPGQPIDRTRLARDLWEELDYSVSGNRLRTTLIILKRALEPRILVEADRQSIWINGESTKSDFSLAETTLTKVRVLQDLDDELETLHRLLDIIDQPFLLGFEESWVIAIRTTWLEHRVTSLLRVAQIQEDLGFLNEAVSAIERIFVQDAYHSQAWTKYLRLMARSDRCAEVLSSFQACQLKMQSELGLNFDPDVVAIANQVRHGAIRPVKNLNRFSSAERMVLIAALEHMATTAPDEFLGFLASQSFRDNIFQRSSTAFTLILDGLNNSSEMVDVDLKGKVIVSGMTAAFTLSFHEEREALCQMAIDEYPVNSKIHTNGLAQLSFLKFEKRDMVAATKLAKRAIFLSKKHHQTTYNPAMESSLAACYWHCLKYSEAEEIYRSILMSLSTKDDNISLYNQSLTRINWAFLKSFKREWTACYELCAEANSTAILHGFDVAASALASLFGCAKVMNGLHGGPKLIIGGLKDSYRQRNIRVVEISLDYAACALVKLGDFGRGLRVVDLVTILRDNRLHARSMAEQSLVDWIREEAKGKDADLSLASDASLLDVLLYACEALEAFLA